MIYLDYAARGRTAWWRYLTATLVGLAIYVLLSAMALAALMFAGATPKTLTDALTRPDNPLLFFPANGLVFGAVLLGFIGAARLIQAKRFADIIGLWRWRSAAVGAGLWLSVLVAGTLIDYAISPSGFAITASGATVPLALAALFGLTIQTFAEEFIFRGYLTQGLMLATRRPIVAALLSGALFGALHIPNGTPQALQATAFGVVTALIAIRTGGIAFGYGLHLVNNLFGAVVVVSADDVFKGAPGLLAQHTPRLMGWDVAFDVAALLLALWFGARSRSLANPQSPIMWLWRSTET